MDQCETGVQVMTDVGIISTVQSGDITEEEEEEEEDEEEDEEEECAAPVISHKQAEEAFDTCLLWLEKQEEATPMNLYCFMN